MIGFPDYVVIKYDSSGNLLWVRSYDGGWSDKAQDVVIDNKDNIIVTGYSDSNINWDWCTVKYSPDGDSLWTQRYDVSLSDFAYRLKTDKDCNIIVAGGIPAKIIKYNPSGTILWEKIYPNLDVFYTLAVDESNDIYLGRSYAKPGSESYDISLMKCNSLGESLWTTIYDRWDKDYLYSITVDSFNNIVVAGSCFKDSIYTYRSDILLIKYSGTTATEDFLYNQIPNSFLLGQNYPNPFNPVTTINYSLPEDAKVSLRVYNVLGQEVRTLVDEVQAAGVKTVSFNSDELPSGVYFYRLSTGKFTDVKKMLITK